MAYIGFLTSKFPEYDPNHINEWELEARFHIHEHEPKMWSAIKNPFDETYDGEKNNPRTRVWFINCVKPSLQPHLAQMPTVFHIWIFLTKTFPGLTPEQQDEYLGQSRSELNQQQDELSFHEKLDDLEDSIETMSRRNKGRIKFLQHMGRVLGVSNAALNKGGERYYAYFYVFLVMCFIMLCVLKF